MATLHLPRYFHYSGNYCEFFPSHGIAVMFFFTFTAIIPQMLLVIMVITKVAMLSISPLSYHCLVKNCMNEILDSPHTF